MGVGIQKMKRVITEIQSLGIRVPPGITGRKGGAGPAEGRALVINGLAVHVPISSEYADRSPYIIEREGSGFVLRKEEKKICPVEVVGEPFFYGRQTTDGIGYKQIALLHGADCLATTVLQTCRHWRSSKRCEFCGTEVSLKNGMTLAKKLPEQVAEVALAAKRSDRISHVVLTAGTGEPPGAEIAYMAKCAAAVKASTELPIHVQFAPPEDMGQMDLLKGSGVDTVGIHIESFDGDILSRMAPAKAEIGIKRYKTAWKRAVALFGANQVSSFLIAGLGETFDSIVRGSEFLAELGVYPFVVPLRPIPGSRMQDRIPPDPDTMMGIYTAVSDILSRSGLSWLKSKAGCVRCGACSALPAHEKRAGGRLICRPVQTEQEKEIAFAIRNDVFVKEQHLFKDSDIDENDRKSVHLVAELDGVIVGTVRVFPTGSNGHWIGGRLAVNKEKRIYKVGAGLVKAAMKQVKMKNCNRFVAHIQLENVEFFKRLGWETVGAVENHFNRPHQMMVADLDRVPNG